MPSQVLPLKATIVSALAERIKVTARAREVITALKCIVNLTCQFGYLVV